MIRGDNDTVPPYEDTRSVGFLAFQRYIGPRILLVLELLFAKEVEGDCCGLKGVASCALTACGANPSTTALAAPRTNFPKRRQGRLWFVDIAICERNTVLIAL